MKNPLQYINKYPQRTRQMLGISAAQFEDLLNEAKIKLEKIELDREQNKKRINKKGGGRPKILRVEEELCLCIFYLRHLPTFEVLGIQFGISRTEAHIAILIDFLRKVIVMNLGKIKF